MVYRLPFQPQVSVCNTIRVQQSICRLVRCSPLTAPKSNRKRRLSLIHREELADREPRSRAKFILQFECHIRLPMLVHVKMCTRALDALLLNEHFSHRHLLQSPATVRT